jgi:cytochrome b pre-mRNA-processing protein 3
MSFLSRLFGLGLDPREALRPLWFRSVEISRESEWYAHCGVADTVPGRFDMITAVVALVILRLEKELALTRETVYLTELFVEDMDGQLRESGVGDLMVGKHIGKLMSVLGGRLGAYREALASGGSGMTDAVSRNVTLTEGADPAVLAGRLEALARQLAAMPTEQLLAGGIVR